MRVNVDLNNLNELEMREVYALTLVEFIEDNSNIICLEADMGKGSKTIPIVKEKHPDNFIDVGIAEANMIGVGAGLAIEGKIPFCGSFTCFASRRAYDQITISVALANNNVKIVGYSPGVLTTVNGATHMCFQDLAIMRAMPNMKVFSPVDVYELRAVMQYMADNIGPMYMQLNRLKAPKVFDADYVFDPGQARLISEGSDLTVVSTGLATNIVLYAVQILNNKGISIDHLHYPSVKPFDTGTLVESARKTGTVITVENQNIIGGLGGAVCEVLSEQCPTRVIRMGVKDRFGEVGTVDYLIETMGFSPQHIIDNCINFLNS